MEGIGQIFSNTNTNTNTPPAKAARRSVVFEHTPAPWSADERMRLYTRVNARDGEPCSFKCYCGGLYLERPVRDYVCSLYSLDDFRRMCAGMLSKFGRDGLAAEGASISGSLLFARGRGLQLSAIVEFVWAASFMYTSRIDAAFTRFAGMDYCGVVEACREIVNETKKEKN